MKKNFTENIVSFLVNLCSGNVQESKKDKTVTMLRKDSILLSFGSTMCFLVFDSDFGLSENEEVGGD